MIDRLKAGAFALIVTVLVAGAAIGWCARGWSSDRQGHRRRDANAMVAYLTKKLDLSRPQQDSVRAVIQRHRGEMDAIWRQVHPRVDSLRTVMQAEISAQLTPEQQTRYRDLIARFQDRRRGDDSTTKERM